MYKVSIIIPVYKVEEKYLRKCIESAINQTLSDIEIILVDDGSPDKCGQICDEYINKDNRVKVIHQSNKGLSGARNSGVKEASGEWITFLDGDDWIEKEMCEKLYDYAIQKKVEVVISSVIKDYGNKIVKYDYSKFINKKVYEKKETVFLQKEILDYKAYLATAYAKLIKRSLLINKNIFHNEELRQGAEGIEFNFRLFKNVKKVFFTNEYYYHYMYNPNSISSTHNEKNHMYVLKCFEEIKKQIDKTVNNKDELLEMFYNRILYVIITTAISGYFNPENKEKFEIKKKKYIQYLKDPLIQETLEKANLKKLDKKRFIIIKLIQFKCYRLIALLAKVRKKQKDGWK